MYTYQVRKHLQLPMISSSRLTKKRIAWKDASWHVADTIFVKRYCTTKRSYIINLNSIYHWYMHQSAQYTHLGLRYYSDCNLMLMFLDCYPGMFWCQNENGFQFILNCFRINKGCHTSLTISCILIMTHKKYSHFIEIIYLCMVMKAYRYSSPFF